MPAGSEAAPAPGLPRSYRPFGVRLMIIVLGTLLTVVALTIWFAFPAAVRAQFTAFQLGTVIVLGLGFYACGYALARSRVVAREDGLTLVNGYRSRRVTWNEVIAVSLRPGSPWAIVDLSDGTSVAAMGIQASDGPRAQQHVREVRALVKAHTH